jgi:hypothetical protein
MARAAHPNVTIGRIIVENKRLSLELLEPMTRSATTQIEQLPMANDQVAERLEELADLLEAQGANPFRCGAYRTAAQTVRKLTRSAHEILSKDGTEGLMRLPGVGRSLARTIEGLIQTGRTGLLDRLRGDSHGERALATVAGIGPKTAAMIHEELGIETLPELEAAAYDGRLAGLPGMGPKKVRSVRESLAGRFRRRPQIPETRPRQSHDGPPVGELLDIDEEYRRKAEADRLPRIAPPRFNPTGQAWLPILHTHRDDRHYTALYSNTARAHEMGTTHDWVVIYRDDSHGDGQWTVVTSQFGKLKGRRVVRGREAECADLYAAP